MDLYYNSETQFYNCKWCNKKYKRDSKLTDHIETNHPLARLYSNHTHLSDEEGGKIIDLLKDYCKLLKEILHNIDVLNFQENQLNGHIKAYLDGSLENELNLMYRFIHASHMLLPVTYKQWISDNRGPIDESDLFRMIENHLFFLNRVNQSTLLSKIISQTPGDTNQLELLLKEFERFLNLGMTWRNDNFCPSLVIDFIWHACMMDNSLYMKICNRFFKTLLPHCLPENEEEAWDKEHHEKRYAEFERHFTEYHSSPPLKIDDLVIGSENAFDVYKTMLIEKEEKEKMRKLFIEQLQEEEKEKRRINDEKRRIAHLEYLERQKKEKEEQKRINEEKRKINEERNRIVHLEYLEMLRKEEQIRKEHRENYFKQHGRYPPYQRPSWDDGKC